LDLDKQEFQVGRITIGKLIFYFLAIQYPQRLIEQERGSGCIIDLLQTPLELEIRKRFVNDTVSIL
jgi:hypothetical protein